MSAAKIIGIAVKTATIRELAHERPGTYPGRSQGVILTPKHQIIGKMTPFYFVRFSVFVKSKEIFQQSYL